MIFSSKNINDNKIKIVGFLNKAINSVLKILFYLAFIIFIILLLQIIYIGFYLLIDFVKNGIFNITDEDVFFFVFLTPLILIYLMVCYLITFKIDYNDIHEYDIIPINIVGIIFIASLYLFLWMLWSMPIYKLMNMILFK